VDEISPTRFHLLVTGIAAKLITAQ